MQKNRLRRLLDLAVLKIHNLSVAVYRHKNAKQQDEYWISGLALDERLRALFPDLVTNDYNDISRLEIVFPNSAGFYSATYHALGEPEDSAIVPLPFTEELVGLVYDLAKPLALATVLKQEGEREAAKRKRRGEKILQKKISGRRYVNG